MLIWKGTIGMTNSTRKGNLSRVEARKRAIELVVARSPYFRCIAEGCFIYKNLLYVYLRPYTVRLGMFDKHTTYFYRDLQPHAFKDMVEHTCLDMVKRMREECRSDVYVKERKNQLKKKEMQSELPFRCGD